MLDVVYRRGDVIRFRRGSTEYVGRIVRIYRAIDGLEVHADRIGGMRVATKHVVQIVDPMLTEKECHALLALRENSATVRGLRESGRDVSGTTLHGLERRGLVASLSVGVASVRTRAWGLTEEGRRVARAL